uniref:Aminotransferase-like plant mobile domain-containing protein n=1 Tax=Fagus sylvatica TaxID=28930 RepID=A0A2N9IE52_FAGSY
MCVFFCWRLEIYLSLKLGGSTVWNLSPNRLRGDLTWGLPKLQIGWFNGLESQSKQVEGCKSGGSTVWNLSPNRLRGDLTWGLPKLQIGWFNGLESLSPNTLRGDLTWGLPKLQIGWFNGLESQSKQVEGCKSGGSTVWNLSPNRLRGDLTWGLPKLQIGGSTVWNLSPNRLRGDLTWGLPKLQIGWFNGLESQSKHVEGCKSGGSTVWNLSPNRLRGDLTWDYPSCKSGGFNGLESQSKQVEGCKSGGSTVWNLSPNRLRGDLTWGLPKLQIGWFNGLESQSKQVEGDLTWGLPKLQIGWFNGLESQSKQVEGCKSGGSTVWNLSPNRLRGDLTWGLPKLQIGWFNGLESQSKQLRGDLTWGLPKLQIGWFNGLESQSKQMSDRGSGSGGHRRSDRLAKGKAVAYAPESSPDTDDEYDAMEDVLRLGPPPRPGVVSLVVVLGLLRRLVLLHSLVSLLVPAMLLLPHLVVPHTRSTGIPPSRLKRQRTEGIPDSAGTIPEDYVAPGFRYPPHGGIRPRYPVAVEISDTPLLTNLLAHPSSLVRRCQEPPYSAGRGGWSEFSRLLAASRPEYREFLIELGFGPFLSIPYVSVYHPAVWCFIERFFHHTGTFHLSTCEMAVLPVDWSAILGHPVPGVLPVRIRHLADVLRRDREEPPTELRYRQWAAYLIFSCFLGNDRSIRSHAHCSVCSGTSTPLREYDWGALTYGFYIRGLRRYSRRESISFLGFWQFTVFWAFEHFPTFAPSRTSLIASGMLISSSSLTLQLCPQRPEVFRAVALSRLRLWIRTTRSWELLLGERTVRQLGDEAVVPVDPSPLMTIEDYIPRAPSDPYIAGVSAYPSLVREGVPYQEWFEQVSLGSLMSLHEVEGGRVMGGVAMDSHHIRSSGQIERLESEILRLQLELSVSVDRHTADMDRVQGEMASMQTEATQREGEMVQMQRDLAQSQRDLGSRDAALAAAAVRRLEEQLQGMGITPVTGADPSGLGQPSSSPPRDPVSRDWFFDDPPSS